MNRQQDIRIFVVERDIYARQAIVSYLSWDRRTRVVGQAGTPQQMFSEQEADPALTRLDAVILDTSLANNNDTLVAMIHLIQEHDSSTAVICLAHEPDPAEALAAREAGACAYFIREQVGVGLASAVRHALSHDFIVTQETARMLHGAFNESSNLEVLPERRNYPRLTDRIEQALWLCVVEGLPAERAAEEMGVSTSTVRSYIKEGYRILEAGDDTVYPSSISPAERAFLRYTALELPNYDYAGRPLTPPYQPAA